MRKTLAFLVILAVAGLGDVGAANPPALAFPQFVSGDGNTTRIILRNNGDATDTGQILFRDAEGNPASVFIGGANRTTLPYSLPPYAVLDLESAGGGPLRSGSVAVVSDLGAASALEGTLVFKLLGFRASVPASDVRHNNQVFVTRNPGENTGLAAFNPDPQESADMAIRLLDHTGAQRATTHLIVPPLHRVAVFVDDPALLKFFFDLQPEGSSFGGTLNAACDRELAVIGLVQDRGDFSLVVTETSATGDFPNIGPPPSAALCGCSAELDGSNTDRVRVRYGMEGPEIGSYAGANRLSFEYLQDDTPISLGSQGILNVNIVGCGQGTFNALGLSSFPGANQVRLTLERTGGLDPVRCVARFRD